jgi:hypothetical protein
LCESYHFHPRRRELRLWFQLLVNKFQRNKTKKHVLRKCAGRHACLHIALTHSACTSTTRPADYSCWWTLFFTSSRLSEACMLPNSFSSLFAQSLPPPSRTTLHAPQLHSSLPSPAHLVKNIAPSTQRKSWNLLLHAIHVSALILGARHVSRAEEKQTLQQRER